MDETCVVCGQSVAWAAKDPPYAGECWQCGEPALGLSKLCEPCARAGCCEGCGALPPDTVDMADIAAAMTPDLPDWMTFAG
jgi:hypothetical protein